MATLEIELKQYLGTIDDNVLAECAQLCRIYRLDPDTFNLKWESYAVNHGIESNMTMKEVDELKEILQRTLEKSKPVVSTPVPKRNPMERVTYTKDDIQALSSKLEAHQLNTPRRAVTFATRSNPGKVEIQYNQQLESVCKVSHPKVFHAISLVEHQQTTSFKYMYDKLAVMGEAMNDQLDQFEDFYQEFFPEIEEFENPSYMTQSSIYAIGRIVIAVDNNKLTFDSIQLECSRKFNGARVLLQLDPSFNECLFTGQIVVLYGHNPAGTAFHVEKILQLPFPDPPSTSVQDLLQLEYTQTQQPMLLLIAAGPYTVSDNLLFEPWLAILELVKSRPPDVMILFGPFLDDRHPHIQTGKMELSLRELFRHHFLDPLNQLALPVILVPHIHDTIHEYLTFPQPPFTLGKQLGRILCVPNPVQLCINECVIALISKDVLLDMSKSIYQTQPTDRVQFIGSQILKQRCIYPIFPPPENDGSVDINKWMSMAFQVSPDLVLWPSQLRFHVKEVGTTLFVNPGICCRSQSGGNISWVSILPMPKDKLVQLDADEHVTHRLSERAYIEIVKL